MLTKFNSPGEEQEPTAYLRECITALTNYLFEEVPGRDLVGLRIGNTDYVKNKKVGFTLWRRYQSKPGLVLDVLGRIIRATPGLV